MHFYLYQITSAEYVGKNGLYVKMDVYNDVGGVYGERARGIHVALLRLVHKEEGTKSKEIENADIIPQTGTVKLYMTRGHFMKSIFSKGFNQIEVSQGAGGQANIFCVFPYFAFHGDRLMISEMEVRNSAEPFVLFLCARGSANEVPGWWESDEINPYCHGAATQDTILSAVALGGDKDENSHSVDLGELEGHNSLLYAVYDQIMGIFKLYDGFALIYESDIRKKVVGFATDRPLCFGVSSCNGSTTQAAALRLKSTGESQFENADWTLAASDLLPDPAPFLDCD